MIWTEMNVTGIPDIGIEETYIEFPETVMGTSSFYEMNVHNAGTADLEISDVVSTNTAFTTDWTSLTLGEAEDTTVIIEYLPTETGSVSGSITFVSNDSDEPNYLVGLIGTGLEAPSISINPESYDFGSVSVDDTLETTFTISNNGSRPLFIIQGTKWIVSEI